MVSTLSGGSHALGRVERTGLWSDACGLGDLARLHKGHETYADSLNLGAGWRDRWTATWRFGQTPVTCSVRNLAEVEVFRSQPVRRFTWRTSQWHRPGLEYLVSTDRHHGFESFEEELLLLMADFAADLVEALAQPFRLEFLTADGVAKHTPDYLLLTASGPWLVDVRPAARIRPEDEVKFAASAEAALAAGWNYSVVTGWRRHIVSIVDSLSAGRRDLTDQLGLHEQLLQGAASGPLPFGELVEHCSYPVIARAHALHLLWHRRLGVDMSAPLADSSLVRLAVDNRRCGGES
ncbi:TnsA-like heteromeric transposase endonuclease subunit [Streptomyces sp. NPDC059650]|uniref:TnsA-like heteromeric transposase endonuclease subunit n=1 Tax=Streptomyces sp. NPDC059650 TaxID=3346896 RepID=UPI0036BF8688